MAWLEKALDDLAGRANHGYAADGPGATEPAALATIALAAHGRERDALRPAAWLARRQNANGALGVMEGQPEPCWPTSWAILAWRAMQRVSPQRSYAPETAAAIEWLLSARGEQIERNEQFGHDVTLIGWPWVAGTHSWIEPTSLAVLALRAVEKANHPRCEEATRLLMDRQLSRGGCNYGNTTVLGQELLPHVQPTGLALLALAGERDPRIETTINWLTSVIAEERGTPSLCFGLLGLAAHHKSPTNTTELLSAAHDRVTHLGRASSYQLALLTLCDPAARVPMDALAGAAQPA